MKNLGPILIYYKEDGFYTYDKAVFEEKSLLETKGDQTSLFAIDRMKEQLLIFNEETGLKVYRKIGIE